MQGIRDQHTICGAHAAVTVKTALLVVVGKQQIHAALGIDIDDGDERIGVDADLELQAVGRSAGLIRAAHVQLRGPCIGDYSDASCGERLATRHMCNDGELRCRVVEGKQFRGVGHARDCVCDAGAPLIRPRREYSDHLQSGSGQQPQRITLHVDQEAGGRTGPDDAHIANVAVEHGLDLPAALGGNIEHANADLPGRRRRHQRDPARSSLKNALARLNARHRVGTT